MRACLSTSIYSGELSRARLLIGTEDNFTEINQARNTFILSDKYITAGMSNRDARRELTAITSLLIVFVIGTITFKSINFAIISCLIFALYHWSLERRIFLRTLRFEKDYPTMLISLSSAIRTGKDPLSSLLGIKELFPRDSIMYCELINVSDAIEEGLSEEDAVGRFGATILHPDIALFTTAFVLARREGSSLGPCLQRLTRVTRQRQSFRRKIKSSLAMQKLSAIGIVICCMAIALIQIGVNPKGISQAWNHPFGYKIIIAGLILMTVGIVWMTQLTRARV